jgi:pyruvate/2-oxoacid:ferredoxin oxidoreductase beta subunit
LEQEVVWHDDEVVTKLEQLYGREGISPGHSACQGCGAMVAVRQVLMAAEPPFIVVTPTSCLEVVTSQYPLHCVAGPMGSCGF